MKRQLSIIVTAFVSLVSLALSFPALGAPPLPSTQSTALANSSMWNAMALGQAANGSSGMDKDTLMMMMMMQMMQSQAAQSAAAQNQQSEKKQQDNAGDKGQQITVPQPKQADVKPIEPAKPDEANLISLDGLKGVSNSSSSKDDKDGKDKSDDLNADMPTFVPPNLLPVNSNPNNNSNGKGEPQQERSADGGFSRSSVPPAIPKDSKTTESSLIPGVTGNPGGAGLNALVGRAGAQPGTADAKIGEKALEETAGGRVPKDGSVGVGAEGGSEANGDSPAASQGSAGGDSSLFDMLNAKLNGGDDQQGIPSNPFDRSPASVEEGAAQNGSGNGPVNIFQIAQLRYQYAAYKEKRVLSHAVH